MSDDISKFKVADLKRELKARNLSTTGNKQELQDRLKEAMTTSGYTILKTSVPQFDDEDDVEIDGDADADLSADLLADDLDEDKLLNAPAETEIPTSTTSVSNLLKRKSDNQVSSSSESLAQPKRISLSGHSKISFGDEETGKENTDTVTTPTTPTPESAINTDRKVIKLSGLTVQERLEMRAKKFNVGLPVEAKLEARKERFGLNTSTSGSGSAASVKSSVPSTDPDVLKKRAERFGSITTSTPASTTSSPAVPSLSSADIEAKKKARAERFGLSTGGSTTTTSNAPSTVPTTPAPATDDVLAKRAQRFRIVI